MESLAFYIIYIGMRLLDVVWHFVNVFLRRVIRFQNHIEMHDWWIGLVAECMGNTVFIYEPYLKYRRHGDNASSLHHHPLKKMIFNRLYFIEQLVIRWIQVGWHA